jgi:flagellin-like protein
MRTITKLRRSTRGLSPIFATLILIAIAVIAGIIVYMFTSGTLASMLGGGTAGQEKVAIQSAQGSVASGVTVYVQSTGGGSVALDGAILKNAAGTVVDSVTGLTSTINPALTSITIAVNPTTVGDTYTVTLISKAGGSFVSPSFKATA